MVENTGGANTNMTTIKTSVSSEFGRMWQTVNDNEPLFGFTLICYFLKINGKDTFSSNWENCCPSLSKVKVINIVGALGEKIKRTQPSVGFQEAWAPGK